MSQSDQFKDLYKCRDRLNTRRHNRRDEVVSIRKEKRDGFLEARRQQFANYGEMESHDDVISQEERKFLIDCVDSSSNGSEILHKLLSKVLETGSTQFLLDGQLLPVLFRILVENSHECTNSLAHSLVFFVLFDKNVDDSDSGIVTILDGMLNKLRNKNCKTQLLKQIVQSLRSGCISSEFIAEILVDQGVFDVYSNLIQWYASELVVSEQVLMALTGFFPYFFQQANETELNAFIKCIDVSLQKDAPQLLSCAVYVAYLASDFPVFAQVLAKLMDKICFLHTLLAKDSYLCFAKFITNVFSNRDSSSSGPITDWLFHSINHLLRQKNKMVLQEACYLLTILVSDGDDLALLVVESECMECIMNIIDNADFNTRREACYVLCNLVRTNNAEILAILLRMKIIARLVDLLTVMDLQLVDEVLSSVETLLCYGENMANCASSPQCYENEVATLFEISCGKKRLEFLAESDNFDIQIKACEILDRFYESEDCESQEINDILSSVVSQISSTGL